MVPLLQPSASFKAIGGTFARDPVPPGQLLALDATGTQIFSICDAGGAEAQHLDDHASAAVFSTEGQILSSLRVEKFVNCGSVSANASIAVAGSQSGELHFWEGQTGKTLTELGHKNALGSVCDVDISMAGDVAVSTSFREDGVRIWDVAQEREVQTFGAVFERRSRSGLCKVTSDGRRVFACENRGVHVLDRKTGQKVLSLKDAASTLGGLGNFVGAMDVNGDGRVVVTVNWPRNTLCVWDLRMRRIRDTLRLRGNHGTATVAITENGDRAICSVYPPDEKDRMAVVADIGKAKVSHRLLHGDSRTVACSTDSAGEKVATLSRDGVVRVFGIQ